MLEIEMNDHNLSEITARATPVRDYEYDAGTHELQTFQSFLRKNVSAEEIKQRTRFITFIHGPGRNSGQGPVRSHDTRL